MQYLRKARETQKSGINILLYGPPGTGKSELSRAIAQDIGADLFEVPVVDEEGDACLLYTSDAADEL